MKDAPHSEQFDDYYFSQYDGFAETQHVFLDGNNLPTTWEDGGDFSIFETGFGTGLNFFATWDLFEKTANEGQTLDFVSVEKYPLAPDKIKQALMPWVDKFGDKIETLCSMYPIQIRGVHRIKISQQITLTLIFDDVNEVMPTLLGEFNCWYLDGFSPTKNPEMWTDILFKNMVRLSKPLATFATFTAAAAVKNGLQNAGFTVQKQKGFRYKSDMMVGALNNQNKQKNKTPLKTITPKSRIAIIGGGLSGTACAYVLKQYGFEPVIYEASDRVGSGASGNDCGFYNPRICALWDFSAQFFSPAYAQFITLANHAGDAIDYNPCGALHLINSPEKQKRFSSMLSNWEWPEQYARILNQEEASEVAGIDLDFPALYLPHAGSVSPKKLCEFYAQDIEVHTNTKITDLNDLDEEAVIICNAYHAKQFNFVDEEMAQTVRGQISKIKTNSTLENLRCNIHFSGYISANLNNKHSIGATFKPWEESLEIKSEDHQHNIESFNALFPSVKINEEDVIEGWAGLRTASKDHFPVIGRIFDEKNIFISLAFGSHGLVGSLQTAHILADYMRGKAHCLQFEMKKGVDFHRFRKRKAQKMK